ncbi:UNKNOWN [Stylonychia lemnae]|uniref:Uncharacterized protein n=1 Tax=Stylonychia lemnae TaxID=5949 RepID=A0A077ZVQ0_STYLE|nr:UNKNOWN [Stylonychia lemnae]|eukprot:CDW73696.1 UNKNOWN [Stylonychia lemnae]
MILNSGGLELFELIGSSIVEGQGVAISLGAFYALAKYLKAGKTEVEDENQKQLIADLKKLGIVRVNNQGIIPFEIFVELFRSISLKKLSLKEDQQQTSLEEQLYQQVSNLALSKIEITEEQFQQTQQVFMTQPQYQNRFFASLQKDSQQETSEKGTAQKLTRQKTVDAFKYAEELKFESMQAIQKFSQNPMSKSEDYTYEMIIQQTIMADRLFERYGIEDDEFNKAVAQHNLYQDPEIQKILQENMQKLSPDMMQKLMENMMNQGAGGNGYPGGY